MDNKKNKIKRFVVLLLIAALIMGIGAIVKSSIIFADVNKSHYEYSSEYGTYLEYATSQELLFPILFVILSVIVTLTIGITLYFIFTYKGKKDAEIISYVNIALLVTINIILIITESVHYYYAMLFNAAGLNAFLLSVPLLLNCSTILLISQSNNDESSNAVNNENKVTTQETTNEESLMQEEIVKLKHQLKLKKLEEEYLELKKQLEPKSTLKTKKTNE